MLSAAIHRVIAVGRKAHAALEKSRGEARALAAFPDSPYLRAAGEIIWVGARLPAMHPRTVLLASPRTPGEAERFGDLPASAWSARLPVLGQGAAHRVAAACGVLRVRIRAIGEPQGFAALLVGETSAFPLDCAVAHVREVACGCAADDPERFYAGAFPLLGLGPGLTPSGDDFVGAALFGRQWIAGRVEAWREVGQRLVRDVRVRSHEISAALFGDLAAGESFAPLHRVASGLAASIEAEPFDAARELVAIGHSSGWDMLAGLIVGITGTLGERNQ